MPKKDAWLSGNYVSGLADGKPGTKIRMRVEETGLVIRTNALRPKILGSVPASEISNATIQDSTRTSGLRIAALGPAGLLWKKRDRFLVLERNVQGLRNEVVVTAKQGALETLLRDILAIRATLPDIAPPQAPLARIRRPPLMIR